MRLFFCRIAVVVTALSGSIKTCNGDIIASESFLSTDYTVGSIANQNSSAGSGWTGAWVNLFGTGATFTGTGLSYPGYASFGGAIQENNGGIERSLANAVTSGTVYFGFLVNPTTLSSPGGGGVFGASLRETANDGGFARPIWGNFPDNNLWKLQVSTTGTLGSQIFTSTIPVALNQTTLLVTRVDMNHSGADEQIRLYVNPTAAGEPGTADLTSLRNIGTPMEVNISSNVLGTTTFDEFRIATSYDQLFTAIPEPNGFLLLALVAIVFVSGKEVFKLRSPSRRSS